MTGWKRRYGTEDREMQWGLTVQSCSLGRPGRIRRRITDRALAEYAFSDNRDLRRPIRPIYLAALRHPLTKLAEPSIEILAFPLPHFRMIIQTLIPRCAEPIRRPPPALGKLAEVILVQEFTLVAHDAEPADKVLADRVDFFLFSRVERLRWRRDKVCGGGHGVAFGTCGGTEGASFGREVVLAYLVV